MNQVPPVPLPRLKPTKRESMPSPTTTSPHSQLPPTPQKKPIPLPRIMGIMGPERNILATLTRRSSNTSPGAAAVNDEEEKVGMDSSLDGMKEFFRTINFTSPFKEEKLKSNSIEPKEVHIPKSEADEDISGRDTPPSPEPPFYPPPPLPDESVYETVQSLPGSKSSPWVSITPRPLSQPSTTKPWSLVDDDSVEENYNSSTHSQYYPESRSSWTDSLPEDRPESIYEDIMDNLESQSSAGGGSSQTGDYSSGSEGYPFSPKKLSLLRCDSWSFYDTVETSYGEDKVVVKDAEGTEKARVKLLSMNESGLEEYENVVIVSPSSTVISEGGEGFNWGSGASRQSSVCSSNISIPNAPGGLFPGRIPLLIPSTVPYGSSPTLAVDMSSEHSSSSRAELEDGDVLPDKMWECLRKKDNNSPRQVTQSVILEFDPLFDKNSSGQLNSSSRSNDIAKLLGTPEEPPYGKIKKSEPVKSVDEKLKHVDSSKKDRKSIGVEKTRAKLLSIPDNVRSSLPLLDPLSNQCQSFKSCTSLPGEKAGIADIPKSVQCEKEFSDGEKVKKMHFLPDEPPPPPKRIDSIEQVPIMVEFDSSGGISDSKVEEVDLSVAMRARRPSFRMHRWNSVKQHAKKFLNGVTGDRNSLTNSTAQTSESSEPKLSIFYQQNMDVDQPPSKAPESGAGLQFVINQSVQHNGLLYQVSGGAVSCGAQARWFSINNGSLFWWRDRSGLGPSSNLPLERLTSICITSDRPNPSADGESLSCFELGVLGSKTNWIGRPGGNVPPSHTLLLGSVSTSERRVWMQKLLESIVPSSCFPNHAVMDFMRAGCAFVKEGISGNWFKTWLLLYHRILFYCPNSAKTAVEANLQHARCIKMTKEEDGKGPSILVDTQGGHAIYIRPISVEGSSFLLSPGGGSVAKFLGSKSAISGWKSALKSAAIESGLGIAEQQLTLENVPVIVDKCLNFIYAHGGMSEGIYRRSGSNSSVTRLLTTFKHDAWDVQLTRRDYSEYDVASALKRFLRDLPEPLLTANLHDEFCQVAESKGNGKVSSYRELLEKLPPINYATLRRLLAHLNFVHGQRERNLMPVENLAAIWGPTLMHVEGNDSLGWSRRESEVVMDLVYLFTSLFDVSPEEEERERQMQEVLERYHLAASGSPASSTPASPSVPIRESNGARAFPGGRMPPSGDLKVWVHILTTQGNSEKGNKCVHITLNPQKLSEQVVVELCQQIDFGEDKKEMWNLEEHVLGGALIRPLHPKERVLDAVLRWGYWEELDRRDNFIALAPATLFAEVAPLIAKAPVAPVSGDLRYADVRSKSFKTYLFEFSQAKLSYYKDKRGSVKLGEWKIEDILWYMGHEPKRNPQSRWSITFINKHKKALRSREAPFFGNTIAGTSSEEKLRWVTALLAGEHPEGISYPLSPDLMQ